MIEIGRVCARTLTPAGAGKMLLDRPRLSIVAGFALLAVLFQVSGETLPGVWAGASFVLQFSAWGLASVSFIAWVMDQWSRLADAAHMRDSNCREVQLAKAVQGMTFEQLEIFRYLIGDEDPVLVNLNAEGRVPTEFVRSLVAQSKGRELIPGRSFSDGSRNRMYYQTVVNYLTDKGMLEPARGNRPAVLIVAWKDALEALKEIQD